MASSGTMLERAFALAKEQYAEWGVDAEAGSGAALDRRASRCTAGRGMTSAGSTRPGQELGGGLAVTGHYPGKARTADESFGATSKRRWHSCPARIA